MRQFLFLVSCFFILISKVVFAPSVFAAGCPSDCTTGNTTHYDTITTGIIQIQVWSGGSNIADSVSPTITPQRGSKYYKFNLSSCQYPNTGLVSYTCTDQGTDWQTCTNGGSTAYVNCYNAPFKTNITVPSGYQISKVSVITDGNNSDPGNVVCASGPCSAAWQDIYSCAQLSKVVKYELSAVAVPPTCGNGTCGAGETCNNCPQDCGSCPISCGNGACDNGETCSTCSQDCGACACTPPNNGIPTNLSPNGQSYATGQAVNLSWTANSCSTGQTYQLWIWNDGLGSFSTTTTNTSYSYTPGIGVGTYTWNVCQLGQDGTTYWSCGTPINSSTGYATATFNVTAGCTVSLSTPTPTISVGQTALVTANVTNVPAGTTIGSINWTSSAPTIGTIPSPTVTGIISNNVTGVSAGTTNISATVNLSPSGSCSTATSLGITVLPRSWWQVSGGDVYANNINSQIPLSCATGCYINLAN